MKKIIVVLMAVVVLVSTLCLFAFAADYYTTTVESSVYDLDDHIKDDVNYALIYLSIPGAGGNRLPSSISNQSEVDSNIGKLKAFNYFYNTDNISIYDKCYLVPIIDDRVYFLDFIIDNNLLYYNSDNIEGLLSNVVVPSDITVGQKYLYFTSLSITCIGIQSYNDEYSYSPSLSSVDVYFRNRGTESNSYSACHEFSDFNSVYLNYNNDTLLVNNLSMENFNSKDYYFDFSTDVPTVVFDTEYRDTSETEDNYASFRTTGSNNNVSISDYYFNTDNIYKLDNEHYILRPSFYKLLKEYTFSNILYTDAVYEVYSYNEINPLIPTFTNTIVSSIGSFVSGIGASFSSAFSALFLTESGGLNVLAIFLLVVAGVSLGYGVIRWITGLFRKEK